MTSTSRRRRQDNENEENKVNKTSLEPPALQGPPESGNPSAGDVTNAADVRVERCETNRTETRDAGHDSPETGNDDVADGDASAEDLAEDAEFAAPPVSLWSFVTGEINRGYALENEEEKFRQSREQVYTFIRIPKEMEKFMVFGLLQLTDAFLYVFTFLPIRVLLALLQLRPVSSTSFPGQSLSQRKLFPGLSNNSFRKTARRLAPAQICDLHKGIILVVCAFCLHCVDTSRMYHVIRGQAVIKLYIFFNMLEVADRLLASFGQDILEALFWTATEPRGRKREHLGTLPHLGLAIIYVFLHTMLMLFQATTLNVAFNSHNKALLTIMMSNNFVELKGSVFKKFEKNNLFQMSCSDVRERFHLCILLLIVITRNMTEFNWNWDHLWVILPDALMVLLAEFLVDWVKHAFITKFNEISDDVYTEYRLSLAQDLAASRQRRHAIADEADVLSRRMGFCPLPLAILLFRILCQSVTANDPFGIVLIIVAYALLFLAKIAISLILLAIAHAFIVEDQRQKGRANGARRNLEMRPRISRRRSLHEISGISEADKKEEKPATPEQLHRHASDPSPRARLRVAASLGNETPLPDSSLPPNAAFDLDDSNETPLCLTKTSLPSPSRSPARSDAEPLTQRGSKQSTPLSQVDRFTMCSNRIV